MHKIKIKSIDNVGGVYTTEEISCLSEIEVIKSFENSIIDFIVSIDSDFFSPEELEEHTKTLNHYNKEKMNNILKEKSKKKLKHITLTGSLLFNLMKNLEIKINKNGFYFLAFLNDLYIGEKTLN